MTPEKTLPFALETRRISRMQIEGQSIVVVDFLQATPSQSLAMLDELAGAFEGQPLDSVLVLTDVTGVAYDSSISQKWRAAFLKFMPYVKASAVYGANGLVTVVIQSYIDLLKWFNVPNIGDKIRPFTDREKALAWLLKR